MTVDDAVVELNTRFREHGIGYQFESNKIVRVDSQFLHQEAVKPALQLLLKARRTTLVRTKNSWRPTSTTATSGTARRSTNV